MMESRLILEPLRPTGDLLEAAARLESPAGTERIWFRFAPPLQSALTPSADPFVIAFTFTMLQRGGIVRVQGRVSPSLLANLERHAVLWHAWCPDRYHPVAIRADDESEAPPPATPGKALVAFSGGVDSCFTVFRHTRIRDVVGRRALPLHTGLVIHGMDIRLTDPHGPARYAAALTGARTMLGSVGMACIPVTTNFREVKTDSRHSHPTMLASALHLFGGAFDTGIIPNSVDYTQLATLWGSHPLSDPLLGSKNLPILDDGVEHTRSQKLALLTHWAEAMQHLRVCFGDATGNTDNCCRCEKCIRTILACRIAGIPQPPALPRALTPKQIRNAHFHSEIVLHYWKQLVAECAARGLQGADWAKAMRTPVRRYLRRQRHKRLAERFVPLRNVVRQLTRGSTLSRSELAKMSAQKQS